MRRLFVLCSFVVAAEFATHAQTPLGTAFTYQGRLENSGSPASGVHDLRFRLYDASGGGAQVGATVCFDNVSITDGLFTVPLDFGAQFTGQERFLEIDVRADSGPDCTNASGFTLLTPRQALTAAPHAAYAMNADQLDGMNSTAFLQSIPVPLTLSGSSTTHIISGENSSTFSGASAVFGISLPATGLGVGGRFQSNGTDGRGVHAEAPAGTGTTYGVYGQSASTGGRGVYGLAYATTGATYGGRFDSLSTDGRGVYGLASAASGATSGVYGDSVSTTGIGVRGRAQATTGANYGGFFATNSTSGIGVYGDVNATTGTNYGVYGESASTSGRGVFGSATAASGSTYGVGGQTSSTSGLGVFGYATADTGAAYGVYGRSDSSSGRGVFGVTVGGTGNTYGVYGQSDSPTGDGVFGRTTTIVGQTNGGSFESASNAGRGVFGSATSATGNTYGGRFESDSTSGIGVFGQTNTATGVTYGVYGLNPSTSGRAVYGLAYAESGTTYGGRFESESPSGRGVFGWASANSGSTNGVRGESDSTSGRGVFGWATAATGTAYGVYGLSNSESGIGVYGLATSDDNGAYGVFGEHLNNSFGSGVYGLSDYIGVSGRFNHPTVGYGVFSYGTLGASGAKTFRIDHPDDPENKYLLHYSAESPEVINFYRGTVMLDGAGEAVVELPHYFAKINKMPSYQLTAIGAPMPMLHVAEKISESALSGGAEAAPSDTAPMCFFRIAGGAPGGEASWEVKAVRNDKWIQQRGAPVEIDKHDFEKGTYQHPEIYGQPPEKGVDYVASREVPSQEVPSSAAPREAARIEKNLFCRSAPKVERITV